MGRHSSGTPGLLYTAEEHQLQDEWDALTGRMDATYNRPRRPAGLPPRNSTGAGRIW
jgi:hypothetical protein